MKAHKYWSLGALACMAGCFYTGCKKLMQAHKYFACGSLVCMGMAIYSGHKIAPKKKAEKPEKNKNKKRSPPAGLVGIYTVRQWARYVLYCLCWNLVLLSSQCCIFR